jgi:hypothetical protein
MVGKAILVALALALSACGSDSGAPPPPVVATPPSFGADGRVVVPQTASLRAMQVDEAGNIYLAGETGFAKLDPAGNLVFNGAVGPLRSLARDAEGNLYALTAIGPLALHKFDATGQRVNSFGEAGIARITFTATVELLEAGAAVRLAPNGDIYVVGTTLSADRGAHRIAVARLDRSGRLSTGFGEGGKRVLPLQHLDAMAQDAVVDRTGHLLVLVGTATSNLAFVVKLDPDGNPVPGYGVGGEAAVAACTALGTTLALAPDDGLFISHNCLRFNVQLHAEVTRLDRDGRRVEAFGEAGIARRVLGEPMSPSVIRAMVPDAGGGVYVAGAVPAACGDVAVARLDANGRRVAALGVDGVARYDLGGADDFAAALAFDAARGWLYVGAHTYAQCGGARPTSPPFLVLRVPG